MTESNDKTRIRQALIKHEPSTGALAVLKKYRPKTFVQWWALAVVLCGFVYFTLLVSPLAAWTHVASGTLVILGLPLFVLDMFERVTNK